MSNIQDRDWYVEGHPLYVNDEETLGQALGDVITILTRLGGGFVIAADRQEVAPGHWMTVGYHIKWNSFVPGRRYEEPEDAAADEPLPVEEPAAV